MTVDLTGKVVAITGAAGGIGREAALAVARSGAAVALGDLDETGLRATEDAVRSAGGRAASLRVDVREAGDVAGLMALARERFGTLTGALYIAGIIDRESLLTLSVERWKTLVDVNLTGTFLTVQPAAGTMIVGRAGRSSRSARALSSVGLRAGSATWQVNLGSWP